MIVIYNRKLRSQTFIVQATEQNHFPQGKSKKKVDTEKERRNWSPVNY
jgi:hypothetical protein